MPRFPSLSVEKVNPWRDLLEGHTGDELWSLRWGLCYFCEEPARLRVEDDLYCEPHALAVYCQSLAEATK